VLRFTGEGSDRTIHKRWLYDTSNSEKYLDVSEIYPGVLCL
jgi:hypothetical protein